MAPRAGFVRVNRLRHGHEVALAGRLDAFLRRQAARIAGSAPRLRPAALAVELRRDDAELAAMLRASIVASGGAMARLRLELLAAARKSRLDERVIAFARERAAERVRGIDQATQARVGRVIARAVEQRTDLAGLSRQIESTLADVAPSRARQIARTEVGTATSFGDDAAARESGVPMLRVWLTARDGGLRHPSADGLEGQTRELGEPFDVRGYALDYPLDPSGPASEVVNCRCALDYQRA